MLPYYLKNSKFDPDLQLSTLFMNIGVVKTYESLFYGATLFEPSKLIWKSWASKKCKFFL